MVFSLLLVLASAPYLRLEWDEVLLVLIINLPVNDVSNIHHCKDKPGALNELSNVGRGNPPGNWSNSDSEEGWNYQLGNFRAVYGITQRKRALAPGLTQTLEGYSNRSEELWNNSEFVQPPPAVPAANFHGRIEQEMEGCTPGVPATPKGLRSPDVSFLVLLSRSSILPTRTIWHTKLIFSLFRSLLPRSYKQY